MRIGGVVMNVYSLEEIRNIISPIAARYGVSKVYLFGSRARGDNEPDSDYDFLISRGDINTIISHMEFVYDLEDAFGVHVDVVTDDMDDREFLNMIKEECIGIYERKR